MSIEFTDLKDLILNWAEERKRSFLASDVYTEIDEAEDVKQASDAVRTLWVQGLLVRKKIDGVRFAYSLLAYAPDDFEMVQKKDEPEQAEEPACSSTVRPRTTGKNSSNKIAGAKEHKEETEQKTVEIPLIRPPIEYSAMPAENVKQKAAKPTPPPPAEKEPIELPDNFILQLKTPGGLVITIKSGVA